MNKTKKNKKPKPNDMTLYDKIKKRVYKKIPKHSAYRSGIVVQQYKNTYERRS